MTQEQRLLASAGTIQYAVHLIREQRQQLGLPFNEGVPKLTRQISAVNSALSSLAQIAKKGSWLSLPAHILSGGVKLAGLVYGHFGERKMRPLKQDF